MARLPDAPWYTERDFRRGRKRLFHTLQLIAADPKDIQALEGAGLCYAEFWPLAIFSSMGHAEIMRNRGDFTNGQFESLQRLHNLLEQLWCVEGGSHWYSQEPEPDPKWSECRALARELLGDLGIKRRTRVQWLLWG